MIKDDTCLVAGNLLLVADGFSQQLREDMINSLLFSQLYASAKVEKLKDADRWYKECATAMENVKWQRAVYRSKSFEPEDNAEFVVRDAVVSQVLSLFGVDQAEMFERLINCIGQSLVEGVNGLVVRENAVTTLEFPGYDFSTIVLQMGVLGAGPALYSVFVCFDAFNEVEVDFLNQRFSGKHIVGNVSFDFAKQLLDHKGFERSRMREKIIDILPDSRDELVLELCLEDID